MRVHRLSSEVQGKEGGRKVVAVISASGASTSRAAAKARDAAVPPAPFDGVNVAYRASKAALNRRECARQADEMARPRCCRASRQCQVSPRLFGPSSVTFTEMHI